MNEDRVNKDLILPVGTRVVTMVEVKSREGRPLRPIGAVGLVVKAPLDNHHPYRVRFHDGAEAALKRNDLKIFSHFQREGISGGEGLLAGKRAG
ncbi:MAG TPA: hypothetical protein VM658_06090 [bacterium]|nr:hypothetical protein [bacterium]